MDVQSSSCAKTPPGTRQQYCRLRVAVCIDYIPLNQVTRPIVYSIPHCNSAINLTFGSGQWTWLWDAPSGYHQIGVSPCSEDKLAFAGPDATEWTYNVMLFGPVNGPPTFIAFIHDVDSTWKE